MVKSFRKVLEGLHGAGGRAPDGFRGVAPCIVFGRGGAPCFVSFQQVALPPDLPLRAPDIDRD